MTSSKPASLSVPEAATTGRTTPAITLWEPWASAIACGLKSVETRGWKPPAQLLGRRIAIHSARRQFGINSATAEVVRDLPLDAYGRLKRHIGQADPEEARQWIWDTLSVGYPLGCVVATAELHAVFPTESVDVHGWEDEPLPAWSDQGLCISHVEALLGDYSPGRWAWLLRDVKPRPPVAAQGRQGFWAWAS